MIGTPSPGEKSTGHFVQVTEMNGEPVSVEQLQRTCDRYHWAAGLCAGADVLEVACGAGQGLGLLASRANRVAGGDISPEVLAAARAVAGPEIELDVFGAEKLPFDDASFDRILLFEAIYYVDHPERFVAEAKRVLRSGGAVLLVTANKDLYDFNPSPFSHTYYGVVELTQLFSEAGFDVSFWGSHPVTNVSTRQRILRPVKFLAARLNLIPKTMKGKAWLKRLVFGELVLMPASIDTIEHDYRPPIAIKPDQPDRRHKVIYCMAVLPDGAE